VSELLEPVENSCLTLSIHHLVSEILQYALPNTFNNQFIITVFGSALMLLVNPMVTAMISYKIFAFIRYSRRNACVKKSLTGICGILIESAAPWTVLGILDNIASWLDYKGLRQGVYLVWCAVGVSIPDPTIEKKTADGKLVDITTTSDPPCGHGHCMEPNDVR
jgi:hypothetical protein